MVLTNRSIVGHHAAASRQAHQKLMQGSVRMFATDALIRYAMHHKVALHFERHVIADFSVGQLSTQIFGSG